MKDIRIKRWITYKGKKLPIGEDGKIIKFSKEDIETIKKQYEKKEDKIEYKNEKLNSSYKQIKAINKNNNYEVGTLTYERKYGRYHIVDTYVMDDYRGNGIGKELAQNLQDIAGDKNIYIGTINHGKEKFWEKVTNGNMEIYKTGKHGVPYYKGKIERYKKRKNK